MVVWLVGLAGAGKTTIGRALREHLAASNRPVVMIDGNHIREILAADLGFTLGDRRIIAERLCRLCRLLEEENICVICPVSGLFEDILEWNRRNYREYLEVYIEAPFDEVVQRDQNHLYSRAMKGECVNVVGVDVPFQPPRGPHLTLFNGQPLPDPSELALIIEDAIAKLNPGGHPRSPTCGHPKLPHPG